MKSPERNEDQRRTQNQQERPNKSVENSEQQRCTDQRRDGRHNEFRDRRRNQYSNRCGSPAKNEMFHTNTFRLIYAALNEERESTCQPS